MIHHIYQLAVFILTIGIETTLGLNPPQNVKIVKFQLVWNAPPDDDGHLMYSLQYKRGSNSEDEWHNVSSHIRNNRTVWNITDEFYGVEFRVRAEKGSQLSKWVNSSRVMCVNVNSCAPLVNLSAKPGIVLLTMAHMDQSLEKEHGDHLEFKISSWNVDNRESSEEPVVESSKDYSFSDLETGETYCFQVEYLIYKTPYGKASEKRCAVIPETPEARRTRIFLYSTLSTLCVLTVVGFFIFVIYKNHKKVKIWLRPVKLEIPDHYKEFFSREFPVGLCPSLSIQSLQSHDLIEVIENTSMEENGQEEEHD